MSQNIVIYHKNCLDGTCAAWVASQYLDKGTTYIAVEYSKPLEHQMILPPQREAAEDITLYILDWCPIMEDLDAYCDIFDKVILIDHHESAIKKLIEHYKSPLEKQSNGNYKFQDQPKNLEVFLALNNEWSGAMGTAIWFHMNKSDPTKSDTDNNYLRDHWLVKAVDDRDRWQFKLPLTKEINEGLFNLGFDLGTWQEYVTFNEATKEYLATVGTILIQKKNKDVQSIIQSSAIIDDNAEKIIFCNCPYLLASEVGNILAKDYRMAVLWFMDKEGQISVSLRSNSNTPDWINCSKIAQKLDGGGHANAAGFKANTSFEDMVIALDNAVVDTEQSIIPF